MDAPSPFVVTCEHGGNRIPAAYRRHFEDRDALLDSHRGYDAGALVMAKALARALAAPLVASTTSRLLVDLNRSIGHPRRHSEATRKADAAVRARIVERHYRPYRDKVDRAIERAIAQHGCAIHISSHSFTPVLDGVVRTADVGLLYDPCRAGERELCARWKASLAGLAPRLRVRLNYPYAGKGDGVTRLMRSRYPPQSYIGVELEVNQGVVAADTSAWPELRAVLIESLRDATRSLLAAGRRPRTPPAHASRAPRAPAGGHD